MRRDHSAGDHDRLLGLRRGERAKKGPIEVRNAFFVVDADGTTGNLVAGLVNTTADSATIHISVGDGPAQSVRIAGQKSVSWVAMRPSR